jgi:uncharacterized membrane protein
MAWYTIILIVAAGVFLLTTLGAVIFGNLDAAFDTDMELGGGFELTDVISFKGLLHFVIGFTLTLTVMGEFTLTSSAAGVVAGILFMVVLFYLYRLVFSRLQQSIRYTVDIKDMDAEVYYWDQHTQTGEVFISLEGRPVTVTLKSETELHLKSGQKIKVTGTRHAVSPSNHQ